MSDEKPLSFDDTSKNPVYGTYAPIEEAPSFGGNNPFVQISSPGVFSLPQKKNENSVNIKDIIERKGSRPGMEIGPKKENELWLALGKTLSGLGVKPITVGGVTKVYVPPDVLSTKNDNADKIAAALEEQKRLERYKAFIERFGLLKSRIASLQKMFPGETFSSLTDSVGDIDTFIQDAKDNADGFVAGMIEDHLLTLDKNISKEETRLLEKLQAQAESHERAEQLHVLTVRYMKLVPRVVVLLGSNTLSEQNTQILSSASASLSWLENNVTKKDTPSVEDIANQLNALSSLVEKLESPVPAQAQETKMGKMITKSVLRARGTGRAQPENSNPSASTETQQVTQEQALPVDTTPVTPQTPQPEPEAPQKVDVPLDIAPAQEAPQDHPDEELLQAHRKVIYEDFSKWVPYFKRTWPKGNPNIRAVQIIAEEYSGKILAHREALRNEKMHLLKKVGGINREEVLTLKARLQEIDAHVGTIDTHLGLLSREIPEDTAHIELQIEEAPSSQEPAPQEPVPEKVQASHQSPESSQETLEKKAKAVATLLQTITTSAFKKAGKNWRAIAFAVLAGVGAVGGGVATHEAIKKWEQGTEQNTTTKKPKMLATAVPWRKLLETAFEKSAEKINLPQFASDLIGAHELSFVGLLAKYVPHNNIDPNNPSTIQFISQMDCNKLLTAPEGIYGRTSEQRQELCKVIDALDTIASAADAGSTTRDRLVKKNYTYATANVTIDGLYNIARSQATAADQFEASQNA